MKGRKAQEHPEPRSRFPLGNFLSILKLWLKDIRGAPKDMRPTKILVPTENVGPHLVRTQSRAEGRQPIEHPECVVDCKRPKGRRGDCRPVNSRMEKVCSRPLCRCLDVALGNPVLVVSPDAAERVGLAEIITVAPEGCGGKHVVVRVVGFDFDPVGARLSLKAMLVFDGLGSRSRGLAVVEQLATRVIDKESAAGLSNAFALESVGEAPLHRRLVVIDGDAVAREGVAVLQHLDAGASFHLGFELESSLSRKVDRTHSSALCGADGRLRGQAGGALHVPCVCRVAAWQSAGNERAFVKAAVSALHL